MIDRTLNHYRIMAALGAGGMGEVYLAEDTKLDRKVALKILPADVASNRGRMERFVREAKAAAALNHPNIAHIYEIGDSEGTPFIAMEYVDGVTLREKIHHSGEPLAVLVGYLAQVAEGLAKAHHAGIVHRDLKPDNVMITRDGYAEILDFGLAKLVESRGPLGIDQAESDRTIGTVHQSTTGMVLGTIGYMSPEEASGRVHEIDHRFGFLVRLSAVRGHDRTDGVRGQGRARFIAQDRPRGDTAGERCQPSRARSTAACDRPVPGQGSGRALSVHEGPCCRR